MKRDETPSDAFSLLDGSLADRIRRLEIFSRFRVEGMLHGSDKSPFKGVTSDFLQHRQYFPGDNLKYLDWRVYGKSERLFIREYEELTNVRVSVVLDISGSMDYRASSMTKHEFAIRSTAILLYLAMIHQDSFSLTTFRTDRTGHVPFGSGKVHLLRAFHTLLNTSPAEGTDFVRGLGGATAGIRRRGLTVVFSDFMDDPETIVKVLARLRYQRSDVIAMQVYDPSERELDFNTITRFHDPEGPEVVVVDPQLIQRQYRAAFDEHMVNLKAACRRHGFEHVALPVCDDYDVPVLEYIRHRMEMFS